MDNYNYSSHTKNIIKWYEYQMRPAGWTPEDDEEKEEVISTREVAETLETMADDEEIDLASTGLSEDDQALVADILERFKEAKSLSVEDIIAENSEPQPMSEEDLIAAICAPKQNNVDALVNQAKNS